MKMHISQFAGKLRCQHCNKVHGTEKWPVSGDRVPFYYQKEPGRYNLKVTCPHCGKDWYVVWDDNPGPIRPLWWVVDRNNPHGQVRGVWSHYREILADDSLREEAIKWHRGFVAAMPTLEFATDETRGDVWGMLGTLIYYFKNPDDTFFSKECEEAAHCFEQCLKYTPEREDIRANLRVVKPKS